MQEQYIQLQSGHRLYTKTVGQGGTKLLALHGGPGLTYESFANLPELLNPQGVQVIFYNQLGSQYSDLPEDRSLYSLESFAGHLHEVVGQLRPHFILAHSGAVMVLTEYLLKYQPDQLQGIILVGFPTSFAKFQQNILQLRQQLPEEVLQQLEQLEKEGKVMEPIYWQLLKQEWLDRYYCSLSPWPQPLQDSWNHFSFPVLLNTVGQGPFVFDGPWTSWNRAAAVAGIKVPALLIGFPDDVVFREDLLEWHNNLPDSCYHMCKGGGHFGWWQVPGEFASQLASFIEEKT